MNTHDDMKGRIAALETERADAMKSAAMYADEVDEMEARLEDAQRDRDELVTVLSALHEHRHNPAAVANWMQHTVGAALAKYRA